MWHTIALPPCESLTLFFFLDTQKWLDFESHYIHIVLCVGRGTAALLSLNFLYFVLSIEFIWNVNCPLKYFHELKNLPIPKLPIHHICLWNLLFVSIVIKVFFITTLSDNSHFRKVSPISPNFARLCFGKIKSGTIFVENICENSEFDCWNPWAK
jgi:hypothetical protein